MTFSLKHAKTLTVPDWTQVQLNTVIGGGAAPLPPAGTLISGVAVSSDWGAEHTITSGASTLIGNPTGLAGSVGEITLGSGLSFVGTTLVASGGTPGGSDTQVQFNNAGALGGSANFTWNGTSLISSSHIVAAAGNSALTFRGSVTAALQIQGTTSSTGAQVLSSFGTGINSELIFYRSRATSVGTATVVQSGDIVGRISFYGAQQTGTFSNQSSAAEIRVEIDGTVTSGAGGDMPGRLIFATTADGSGISTTRMTITNAGLINIPNLTASRFVTTDGSKNLTSFDLFSTANTWALTQTFTSGIISNGVSTFNAVTTFTDGSFEVDIIPGGQALQALDIGGSFQARLCDGTSAGFYQDPSHLNLRIMDGTNCLSTVDSLGNFINIGDGSNAVYAANSTLKRIAKLVTSAYAGEFSESGGNTALLGGPDAATLTGRLMVYDNSGGNPLNIDSGQRHLCNSTGATVADWSSTGLIAMSSSAVPQALFGDAFNTNYAISTDSAKQVNFVNNIFAPNIIRKLATITGINGKTVANTALYTVPGGSSAVITGYTVRCSAASAITVGASAGIGNIAGTNNISASQVMTALITTADDFYWTPVGASKITAAAGVVYFNLGTGATGTSQTLVVDLWGYLV